MALWAYLELGRSHCPVRLTCMAEKKAKRESRITRIAITISGLALIAIGFREGRNLLIMALGAFNILAGIFAK